MCCLQLSVGPVSGRSVGFAGPVVGQDASLLPILPTDMLLSVSVLGFRVVDPICLAHFRSLLFSLVCVRFCLVELL